MSKLIDTKIENYKLRFAEKKDIPLILELIKKLAQYENMLDDVTATEETLMDSIFVRNVAEVIIGEYDGKPVSQAIFFYNFSTFDGKLGIYLEDIYVEPEFRGKDLGKILLKYVAKLAIERDCQRFEWACLDWNEPSIKFYKRLGAVQKDEWVIFRVSGDALTDLANE